MSEELFDDINELKDQEIEGWSCPLELFLDNLEFIITSEFSRPPIGYIDRQETYYEFWYKGKPYYVDHEPDSWCEENDKLLWNTLRGYC